MLMNRMGWDEETGFLDFILESFSETSVRWQYTQGSFKKSELLAYLLYLSDKLFQHPLTEK